MTTQDNKREIATLAGGCFWCLEAAYSELQGVSAVQSGYTGGHLQNPSYIRSGGDILRRFATGVFHHP
jgi:peptide methionine sulfoxide reductase MsrA